jgi:endo-1,4-beta-xylanase
MTKPLLCLRTAFAVCLAAAAGTHASSDRTEPALKTLVLKGVLIGAAINQAQSDGQETIGLGIVTHHFNTISPENILKWQLIHPEPERYDFAPADRYVALGQKHGMAVIGHTLVWHQQTPAWVFGGKDGAKPDRETLLARMRTHIEAVAGRYRGRIHGWDVVNEALNDDGTLRKTPWLEVIGEDYIAKAFEYARAADPHAELYYNDYNLWKPEKREGALRIVKQLRDRGLRVDGVGEQGHYMLESPSAAEIDATIAAIAAAAMKPMITELDVDVLPRDSAMYGADLAKKAKFQAETNLYPTGLPPDKQQELARRYADIFDVVMKHRDTLARVTFWGVADGQSWLNDFPVPGRINHPLLWDREGRPKPAFAAVVDALNSGRAGR